MNKWALVTAIICLVVFVASLPAFSAVTIKNTTTENLLLEVKSGKSPVKKMEIKAGATLKCGEAGEAVIVAKSADGKKKLCEGTFADASQLTLAKAGDKYSLAKTAVKTTEKPKTPEKPKTTEKPKTDTKATTKTTTK